MKENLETTTAEIETKSGEAETKLSYEELLKKCNDAETRALNAEADSEKWKNAHNKTSSELAGVKKQLNARLTAEEQAAEAEKEAKAQRDADFEAMKNKVHMFEYGKRYMGIGMDEKTADTMAGLTGDIEDPDKFFSALGKFVQAVKKQSSEDAVQTYLKENPDIKAGSGAASKDEAAVQFAQNLASQKAGRGINEDLLKKLL